MTRAAAFALSAVTILLQRGNVFLDATMYGSWAQATLNGHRIPYRDFPWEYPPAALPAMIVPLPLVSLLRWLGMTWAYGYALFWVGFMLAVDALVAFVALPRWLGRRTGPAHTLWCVGLPLLGALTWARYDLLPAAAALAAVVSAGRQSGARSGRLAGLGGALKIWPALLAPVQRSRGHAVQAAGVAAAVLLGFGLATYVVTGHAGYGSVWRYQRRRGLQVESLGALPLVWLRHLHVPGYALRFRFGAWEVIGPGDRALAMASTVLLGLGLLALAWAHWRLMRSDAGPEGVALTAVGVVLLLLLTDKVLSPQYLLWLIAVLAAACALDPDSWRPYVAPALATCALTAAEFPWFYGDVLGRAWPGLVALSLRDLLILGMAARVGQRMRDELRANASVGGPSSVLAIPTAFTGLRWRLRSQQRSGATGMRPDPAPAGPGADRHPGHLGRPR